MSGQSIIDSTQTVRALTARELRDPNQQKWFAVQLAVSDRPVNLETMPRFDVFANHRLYAIQGRLGAKACYALRLGFFTERESAQTICMDLMAFYRSASVVQVSEAEQARFERVPAVPAQKPVPIVADVVEISSARRGVIEAPKVVAHPTAAKSPASDKAAATPKSNAAAGQGRKKFKSLSQELMDEARQIELAKSGRHSTKQRPTSWLSRWFGR